MEARNKYELHDWALRILLGPKLEDKLLSPKNIDWELTRLDYPGGEVPDDPGRCEKIKFSQQNIKFPKRTTLNDISQKARALHFFANHELLAIEMLAAALIKFPCLNDEDLKFKKTCVATLRDEQKHFSLYRERMNEWQVDFGDHPVNNFFWDKMKLVDSREQFISLLSLTFESANLDFSLYYAQVFRQIGDEKTAQILDEVYRDEIRHVATGAYWMNEWRNDQSLWDYYLGHLPELVTPSRAKGINFHLDARRKAGLDEDFIHKLEAYRDNFAITDRREWKKD